MTALLTDLLEVKRCKSCGAPIWFVDTPAGKKMPVDVTPSEKGNVIIEADLLGRPSAISYARPRPGGHMSHFATCSNPEAWRRR